jgi:hypothetical protein
MKVPISDFALIDLNAPTVAAYAVPHETGVAWGVWCKFCQAWHYHGIGEGHREAHCQPTTPYSETGYNLSFVGDAEAWYPGPPERPQDSPDPW